MSRTFGHGTGHSLNGTKGGGYEYWSKRPGPRSPGKKNKRICHSMERAAERELVREEIESFEKENNND